MITAACMGLLWGLTHEPGAVLAQGKQYRVEIDSEPDGAEVWIDDRGGDSVGTTPHTVRLTAGKHTLFLEREGYEIAVHEITVKKRRKGKQRFSFELVEQSKGSIDVLAAEGADNAEGAKVFLDGEEVGTVPDSFEAPEGAHQVEVVQEGFKRYENWVEVKAGDSVEVMVELEQADEEQVEDTIEKKDDHKPVKHEKRRTGPVMYVDAGMGAGWRRFEYNQIGDRLRPYSANGIALLHVGAELRLGWFTAALSRFSLFGGANLALPVESSTLDGSVVIDTHWFRRELGLRTRLGLGPGHLGVDVAEGRNAFTFDNAGVLVDEIAQAEYEYLRLGLWYGVESKNMAFGGGANGVAVLASKGVSERFDAATIFGVGGQAWFRHHLFAGIDGLVSTSVIYFNYALEANALYLSNGGHDLMIDLIASAAYRF